MSCTLVSTHLQTEQILHARDANQQAMEPLGKTNTFWIAKLAKLRHIDDFN